LSTAPRRPRSIVVATGSELLRGDLADANGPFLSRELSRLGLEPARIVLVGDRAEDLEGALREGLEYDLCIVSGGLGPTHDDRTLEVLSQLTGRTLHLHPELEAEVEAASRSIAERLHRPYASYGPGIRKQASLPAGGVSLGLAGTAPGVALEHDGRAVVVLPGPPGELQRLWPAALASEPVRRVLARARRRARSVLRFYGVGEPVVASALEELGGEAHDLEITICARELEVQVDLLADANGGERAAEIAGSLRERLAEHLFAEDDRPVEEIVLGLCRARGLSLATAESCTGGLVAARLTSVPGSSDVFRGGVVAYSNEVKSAELGVSDDVLARHGSVSPETAAAMAAGARSRLAADVAVGVTGVAGPAGGTEQKPVGLVFLEAQSPAGHRGLELNLPGDRETVRRRATVAALHLVRTLLSQSRDDPV
jgi:nicotinamide-nucleotide amidase